jgi:hypothetical protein
MDSCMTLFNDELEYACAWGRWRIGPALNEPIGAGAVHPFAPRALAHGASAPRRRLRRARLRLVRSTPHGAPEAGS